MIVDFTGMDIANASLLDESTAAAEAMMMAFKIKKSAKFTFCVQNKCHPHTHVLFYLHSFLITVLTFVFFDMLLFVP